MRVGQKKIVNSTYKHLKKCNKISTGDNYENNKIYIQSALTIEDSKKIHQ